MYHIVAAQRQRQYGSPLWKNQPPGLFAVASDTQGLVELARAILRRVGRVNQQNHVTAPGRRLDPVAPGQKEAGTGLEAEPVQSVLAERLLDPLAEIVGSGRFIGLESAGESASQLALRLGS